MKVEKKTKVKQYSAQEFMTSSKLAVVMRTNESVNKFLPVFDYLSDKTNLKDLREKRFRKQDLPISSRVLNDWCKKGLLIDNRENADQWRTFSQIDVAYIHILKACRNFGISIRKLQEAKVSLFTKLGETDFSLIEIAYTYFDKQKEFDDIHLFVDECGKCNVVRADDMISMAQHKLMSNNFFILNLNEAWNEKK